jgi:hypothetical protein
LLSDAIGKDGVPAVRPEMPILRDLPSLLGRAPAEFVPTNDRRLNGLEPGELTLITVDYCDPLSKESHDFCARQPPHVFREIRFMKLETFTHSKKQGWSVRQFPALDSDQTLVLVFGAKFYCDSSDVIGELADA